MEIELWEERWGKEGLGLQQFTTASLHLAPGCTLIKSGAQQPPDGGLGCGEDTARFGC
jgi:hypothetical protein